MGYIIFALVLAAIGGINFSFGLLKRKPALYLKIYAGQAAVIFVVAGLWSYLGLPALVGPFWGVSGLLVPILIVNIGICLFGDWESTDSRSWQVPEFKWLYAWPVVGFLALVLLRLFIGGPIMTAEDRRAMIGEVVAAEGENSLDPIDHSHIRMTSREQAIWAMDKVLGEADKAIGSRFHVGEPSLQKLGDEFLWVAPLEYNAWRHWTGNDGTPGYVTVSAVDPQSQANLVTTLNDQPIVLTYIPSAYFGEHLERFVYERGYKFHTIYDYHFELDDDRQPWWVMTLTEPTRQYSVERIAMVLLIDPKSGEITEYQPSNLPSWVDRVMPDDLVEEYLTWWGHYVTGWWNAFWVKDSVVEPTRMNNPDNPTSEALTLVYGADGVAYWFTGITSTAASDQGLISYVLVNSRTGATREYRMTGPNEAAIMAAVNSAVSNYDGWHATTPVPYHLYGETAWVVPVLSASHIFQKVAIVRATTAQVALGNDKQSALRDFQRLLTGSGNNVTPAAEAKLKWLTLIVNRFSGDVQNGSTVYQLWSQSSPDRIFTGTSQVGPDLPLTVVGDEVEVGYLETTEKVVPISKFSVKNRAGIR